MSRRSLTSLDKIEGLRPDADEAGIRHRYGLLCVFLTVSTFTSTFFWTTVVSVVFTGVTVVSAVVRVVSWLPPALHPATTNAMANNRSMSGPRNGVTEPTLPALHLRCSQGIWRAVANACGSVLLRAR